MAAIPAVAQTYTLLLLPESVSNYLAAKVRHDLPGQQGMVHMIPGVEQMATAMQQLVENVGGTGGGGGKNARETRGVSDAYR